MGFLSKNRPKTSTTRRGRCAMPCAPAGAIPTFCRTRRCRFSTWNGSYLMVELLINLMMMIIWWLFDVFFKLNPDHLVAESRNLLWTCKQITKGSVSYLSSPCFSTIIGGIGGPARVKRGILAVMYWISIRPPPLKWSWVQFPRVTGPHIRGTLSMREMSL